MTELKIEAVEDDGDDVVIIGDIMPKPMVSHDKKKRRRHVEFKKSKYKKESLVITQKVKVKKQKYQCVLKEVDDTRSTQDSVKNSKCENGSEVKDKCERYTPVCLRKTCKDMRCNVKSRSGRTMEKGRTNKRQRCDFPRDLKRMLSPVSPSPLERDLSFDLDISLDTSSLQETDSKLDTLIKRTRDRDRKSQMTRTQYLFTPPHTESPKEDITEYIKTSDITDYQPLYTSTPKYEENDNKTSSIPSNIIKSKIDNSPTMEDIHLMLSPIKKIDDISVSKNINCNKQESQCSSPQLKDTNIKDTKSESVNAAASNTNCEQNMADTTVQISNIKEQVSKGAIFATDVQIRNKSEHVQTDVSNFNDEQSTFSNKMLICNNTDQSMIVQRAFIEDKEMQNKTSEYAQTVVTHNFEQNIADSINISNNNKDQISETLRPSLEKTQIVHKKSEYTQTVNFDTNYKQNVTDTTMLVSYSIVEPPSKSSNSQQLLTQHQSFDIQTIVTNTKELQIADGNMAICNNDYVPSIENPFCKDVQISEHIQTVSLPHNENKIETRNVPINNNAQDTIDHTSLFGDIKAQHKILPDMQTTITDNNNIDSRMCISFKNNNGKEQACTPNSVFHYNTQNRSIEKHMNTIDSKTNHEQNIEDIDMSISYDNDDNVADEPLTYSLTFEDAHLQHRQTEYYLHNAVENTNYENHNYLNRTNDFHTYHNQIAENNEMSISYNNFIEQQNTYHNLFVDDTYFQQKAVVSHAYYEQNNNFARQPHRDSDPFDTNIHAQKIIDDTHTDINSDDYNKNYKQKKYDREKPFFSNYTEHRNRRYSPFFEDSHKQYDINYSHYRKQEHNKVRKMSVSDDINFTQQQDRPFSINIDNQHKNTVYTFTHYSNKKYEHTSNGSNSNIYDNNFKEQQNKRHCPYIDKNQQNEDYNYSAHSDKKQERIRNIFTSYNNSSNEQNKFQSRFSKHFKEYQNRSEDIRTSYYINKQNVGNNFFTEPGRHRSSFNGVYSGQKKYEHMHTDSRKTHEHKTDDGVTSISYKNDNFRENPSKRHSPFYESRHKRSKFNEQSVEERIISNKNTYFEEKRNRSYNSKIKDGRQYLQHRKFVYNSVTKKKEIFIDKRMSDEAYEDVLVGLPPDQVSPNSP